MHLLPSRRFARLAALLLVAPWIGACSDGPAGPALTQHPPITLTGRVYQPSGPLTGGDLIVRHRPEGHETVTTEMPFSPDGTFALDLALPPGVATADLWIRAIPEEPIWYSMNPPISQDMAGLDVRGVRAGTELHVPLEFPDSHPDAPPDPPDGQEPCPHPLQGQPPVCPIQP